MKILDLLTDDQIKSFTVDDFWKAYRDVVYGGDLSAAQEKECKNAMMAGIHAGFDFMSLVSELSESEAMEALLNFHDQLVMMARASNPTGEN